MLPLKLNLSGLVSLIAEVSMKLGNFNGHLMSIIKNIENEELILSPLQVKEAKSYW